MNRTIPVILSVSAAAFACHRAPETSTTQTTSATQPAGPSDYDHAPGGYSDPNGNDNGASGAANGNTGGNPMDTQNATGMTPGVHDYDRSGAGTTPRDKGSLDDDEPVITPMNQADDKADLDTAQAVRSAIRGDDSLAPIARSVDILSNDGIVTLRGHVASLSDKKAIERKARSVSGVSRVDDEMTVSGSMMR